MKNNQLEDQPNNPLHGVRLDYILDYLIDHFGWTALGTIIKINCFKSNPTRKSSLKFLRKQDWARKKVENLYLEVVNRDEE